MLVTQQCQQTGCWPGQTCMGIIVDHLKLHCWSLLISFLCLSVRVHARECGPVCVRRAAGRNPVYRTGPGAGTFTHWAILWPLALSFWFWGLSVFLTKTTGKPSFNYSVCECVPRGSWIGRRTACGVGLLLPLRWIQESNSSSQIWHQLPLPTEPSHRPMGSF